MISHALLDEDLYPEDLGPGHLDAAPLMVAALCGKCGAYWRCDCDAPKRAAEEARRAGMPEWAVEAWQKGEK